MKTGLQGYVDQQFCSELWTLPSYGVPFLVHANWYTFLYASEKPTIILLNMFGRHSTKFSRHGDRAPEIYSLLV
jgi:hypothetical protein